MKQASRIAVKQKIRWWSSSSEVLSLTDIHTHREYYSQMESVTICQHKLITTQPSLIALSHSTVFRFFPFYFVAPACSLLECWVTDCHEGQGEVSRVTQPMNPSGLCQVSGAFLLRYIYHQMQQSHWGYCAF